MKTPLLLSAALAVAVTTHADVIPFAISPGGTSPAVGLSPANEVPAVVVESTGSGDEIFDGITYDTESKRLEIAIGYGSFSGFTDLTGPLIGAHIHGPATVDETAAVAFDFFDEGQHLFAPDPAKGGVIVGGAVLDDEQEAYLLDGMFYVNLHTELNEAGELRGQLVPVINSLPELICPEPVTAECEPPDGAPVVLVAGVSDADGDPLRVRWSVNGEVVYRETVEFEPGTTSKRIRFGANYEVGEHTVEISINDGSEAPVTCETTVTITDTTAPQVKEIMANPPILWPPNHKLVPVKVRMRVMDCSEVTHQISRVESNEPINGKGDGNTDPDWIIGDGLELMLRSERAGGGSGRVYTITVMSEDAEGNSTESKVTVRVPHDQRNPSDRPEALNIKVNKTR